VPRYKALLLKQRDIMIALTERLRERDERILALQDDLDAGDGASKCDSRVFAGCLLTAGGRRLQVRLMRILHNAPR
jgi:hypothetical protein